MTARLVMFGLALGSLVAWGWWRKRHLPSWWPGEPPEFVRIMQRLTEQVQALGETLARALWPVLQQAANALADFAVAFDKVLTKAEAETVAEAERVVRDR